VSGGARSFGDVVILASGTAGAFTTTTTGGYVGGGLGVVLEPNGIADNAYGLVATGGYIPRINLNNSAALLDLVKTYTVAGQGLAHAAPLNLGDFAYVLGTGTTPAAILFGVPNAVPTGGGGDLWTEVIKSADQDVTASATLTDDTELQATFTADTYHVLLYILYSGNTTAGDYKCDFAPSTGNMSGWYRYNGDNTTGDAVLTSTGIRMAAAATITAIAAGTDASHTVRSLMIETMVRLSAGATFKFRFAQNTLTAATVARTKKGSILRYRKLPIA
jgi:hypothetical protein